MYIVHTNCVVKRVLTILMLAVLLFNFAGYRFFLSYVEMKEDQRLEASIEKNSISDEHLVSVKTALNLPYYTNSANFEHAYGAIDVNGVEYKFVKRRVYNDSLELLCYPNLAKKTVKDAKNELFKLSSEAPLSGHSKKSSVVKNLLSDVWEQTTATAYYYEPTYSKTFGLYHQPYYPSLALHVDEQPPDSVPV